MNNSIFKILVFVFVFLAPTGRLGAAEVASVDEGYGHAFLFRHNGNCFALVPNHVARQNRINVASPPPRLLGEGFIFARDEARDLALAFVDGKISSRCRLDFNRWPRDLSGGLGGESSAYLERLDPAGVVDRTLVTIVSYDDDSITVKTNDEWADGTVSQGTSGAALYINGRPAGIALQAAGERQAQFFRLDTARFLASRIFSGLSTASHPSNRAITDTEQSRGFKVTGWTTVPIANENSPTNIERGVLDAPYLTTWLKQPQMLELTLSEQSAIPLEKIELISIPDTKQGQSAPKTVSFNIDSGGPGNAYWRSVGMRDMTPTGSLTLNLGGQYARRIRITIQSLWMPQSLMRLDAIRAN